MSDTEASALSEQTEDAPARRRRQKKAPRPSFPHYGIRYSQGGGEYKSYCHRCDYESGYGTRGEGGDLSRFRRSRRGRWGTPTMMFA